MLAASSQPRLPPPTVSKRPMLASGAWRRGITELGHKRRTNCHESLPDAGGITRDSTGDVLPDCEEGGSRGGGGWQTAAPRFVLSPSPGSWRYYCLSPSPPPSLPPYPSPPPPAGPPLTLSLSCASDPCRKGAGKNRVASPLVSPTLA